MIHPDDRERAIKVSSDAAKERKPYTRFYNRTDIHKIKTI